MATTHMIVMLSPIDKTQREQVIKSIDKHYPVSQPLSGGRAFLVRSSDSADSIARKIGLTAQQGKPTPEQISAIVVKFISAYADWAPPSLWNWLEPE